MPKRNAPSEVSLHQEVKAILERRGYTTDLPVLNELTGSFKFDYDRIHRKVGIYKVIGFVLLLSIPIISTLITFVVGMTHHALPANSQLMGLKDSVPLLSLFLTLLTVLNSVLKPSVRFDRSCRIGLDLFHWQCAFLEELEKLGTLDDKTLMNFLTVQRKALRKIQESQINLALPDHS
jgi:hypothetical protein